jgi:hypothetical protein
MTTSSGILLFFDRDYARRTVVEAGKYWKGNSSEQGDALRRLLLPVVTLGVIIGIPVLAFLAGETEGIHFVISGSLDFSVTRSPVEDAVDDGWPIDY